MRESSSTKKDPCNSTMKVLVVPNGTMEVLVVSNSTIDNSCSSTMKVLLVSSDIVEVLEYLMVSQRFHVIVSWGPSSPWRSQYYLVVHMEDSWNTSTENNLAVPWSSQRHQGGSLDLCTRPSGSDLSLQRTIYEGVRKKVK